MNHFARILRRSLTLGVLLLAFNAAAQDKPVRILVGFAPGGTADIVARLVADKLRDSLATSVIVENRAGATGRITAEALKNSPADWDKWGAVVEASGYTAD